jgi:hypothetical protein
MSFRYSYLQAWSSYFISFFCIDPSCYTCWMKTLLWFYCKIIYKLLLKPSF